MMLCLCVLKEVEDIFAPLPCCAKPAKSFSITLIN